MGPRYRAPRNPTRRQISSAKTVQTWHHILRKYLTALKDINALQARGPVYCSSRVMAKSVDFVICDVLTLDPVAVIEVDDRSHLLPERRDRDAFVNAVFAEIGVPLVRVKAQRSYSVAELRALCAHADLSLPPQSPGASL